MLPGTTLNGGEWVTQSGSSVDCSTDPLRCNVVSSPNASINLYINVYISSDDDGWYKCCLPTDCSNPNACTIFANIYSKLSHFKRHCHLLLGWAQIENISVDLPSDITVLPQTYTLHAIKSGYNDHEQHNYAAEWYYESGTQLCDGYKNYYQCTIGVGTKTERGGGKYDYTVTITWNGETITSGELSQSNNNGDHVYTFYFQVSNVMRNRMITVRGKPYYLT